MSDRDLYTVTMIRSVKVTTPAGEKMQDIIETHYDVTWKGIDVLQAKHAGDVTVEQQTKRLDRMPKIETGERELSTEPTRGAPIDREKVAGGYRRSAQFTTTPTGERKPIKESFPVAAGYASVVNEIMKDSRA